MRGWILTILISLLLIAYLASGLEGRPGRGAQTPGPALLSRIVQRGTVKGEAVTLKAPDLQAGTLEGLHAAPDPNQAGSSLLALVDGSSEGSFTSGPVAAPFPFSDVGVRWTGDLPTNAQVVIELRTSKDGVTWSEWRAVEPDEDLPPGPNGELSSALLAVDGKDLHTYAQARVGLQASSTGSEAKPALKSLTFVFIDASRGPTREQAVQASRITAKQLTAQSQNLDKPPVIPRTAWGSPDGEGSPDWPPEYRTVSKIIIHHTTNANSDTDWAARVRAIWYYHTITQGWGDIGYNYLIDPDGYVYEGRAGGDDVVGGHALKYNWGSLGVGLLGTFTSVEPTQAAQNSLINLMSWKCYQRAINPGLSDFFVDKLLPNIMGHRDAMPPTQPGGTTCPGSSLYALLPTFRRQVYQRVAQAPISAEITSASFEPVTVPSGQLLKVNVTVRNNGSLPLETQGPPPGYVYEEGEIFSNPEFARIRVGVDYGDRDPRAKNHPYRWGLGGTLAPGASTTVTGYIRLVNTKTTNYWAGIAREGIGWTDNNRGTISITVAPFVTISGTVRDNRDVPIWGAKVSAVAASGSSVSATTDRAGHYELPNLTAANYTLLVEDAGFGRLPEMRNFTASSSSTTVDFNLPPSTNLLGEDWDFEASGSKWYKTTSVDLASGHTGNYAARLTNSGELTREVAIPASIFEPTLSFVYKLQSVSPTDRLTIKVESGSTSVESDAEATGEVWRHKYFALDAYKGKTIKVRFMLSAGAGTQALIDEVSVGPASGGPNKLILPFLPNR
ncbi:MAG: N-acetylmuramoyl-L-alanine amidase [Chloroflexi bacterium]|nr:N-acetylmuramoyl-L-alanine amidase [Chloroflexota bacterium]